MQKSPYTDSNASGRLRAVIYNRCSTEEESQREALIQQEREARECVAEQGWILVDIYIEAKSGTTVKGRSEYERLYRDLESGKFDIIVIKSQDRLMRNTKDWYLFLDRMQKNRKRLYIYLDRKFYTPDDALITVGNSARKSTMHIETGRKEVRALSLRTSPMVFASSRIKRWCWKSGKRR